jgi:hypothetical protein
MTTPLHVAAEAPNHVTAITGVEAAATLQDACRLSEQLFMQLVELRGNIDADRMRDVVRGITRALISSSPDTMANVERMGLLGKDDNGEFASITSIKATNSLSRVVCYDARDRARARMHASDHASVKAVASLMRFRGSRAGLQPRARSKKGMKVNVDDANSQLAVQEDGDVGKKKEAVADAAAPKLKRNHDVKPPVTEEATEYAVAPGSRLPTKPAGVRRGAIPTPALRTLGGAMRTSVGRREHPEIGAVQPADGRFERREHPEVPPTPIHRPEADARVGDKAILNALRVLLNPVHVGGSPPQLSPQAGRVNQYISGGQGGTAREMDAAAQQDAMVRAGVFLHGSRPPQLRKHGKRKLTVHNLNPKWACPVNTLNVESSETLGDSAGPDAYREALAEVGTIRDFISHESGNSEMEHLLNPSVSIESRLLRPTKIPFRPVTEHFFSDMDGRANYGVMGTAGGDLGEFVLLMGAVEQLLHPTAIATQGDIHGHHGGELGEEDILEYFQQFLEHMANEGKHLFYHGTDEAALGRLAERARVTDPLSPTSEEDKQRLVQYSIDPINVGCRHLRLMLEHPLEYHVRREVVEGVIKAFMKVRLPSGMQQLPLYDRYRNACLG